MVTLYRQADRVSRYARAGKGRETGELCGIGVGGGKENPELCEGSAHAGKEKDELCEE